MTPINARYHNECTLIGIIPLIARGMSITYGWIRGARSQAPQAILAVLLVLLSINTVHSYILFSETYRSWEMGLRALPGLVKEQDIHDAVIFISASEEDTTGTAPIGDYPFKSLEEADIVYFRLGPSKKWRLRSSDWETAYKRYFEGRNAFVYEGGRLKLLLRRGEPPLKGRSSSQDEGNALPDVGSIQKKNKRD